VETVVGASFLAVVLAFSAQRFLTDVLAGLLMFFEGWFRVGDTVLVEPSISRESWSVSRSARSAASAAR
jgi:small-conductance mechanosensitive channel